MQRAIISKDAPLTEKELKPYFKKRLEKELRDAAVVNDKEKVSVILNQTICQIDINSQDPVFGRTALHETSCEVIRRMLLDHKADSSIRDKVGLTAVELQINSRVFFAINHEKEFAYRRFIVSEANLKLGQQIIFLVEDIFEINSIIERNVEKNRLGFIINKSPNVLKATGNDIHATNIYFERQGNVETFVFVDSVARVYLLPESSDPKIKREVIFTPYWRQAGNEGCFEDTVKVLMALLPRKGFLEFCKKNSVNCSIELMASLNAKEEENWERICSKKEKHFTDEKGELGYLQARLQLPYQVKLFEHMKVSYVKNIFSLTSLPMILFPRTEFYQTMRYLRMSKPQQFLKPLYTGGPQCLSLILKKGKQRIYEEKGVDHCLTLMKGNIDNPDKKFDFAGKSYREQHNEGVDFWQSKRKFVHACFFYKVHVDRGLILKSESKKIVSTILGFVTGCEELSDMKSKV